MDNPVISGRGKNAKSRHEENERKLICVKFDGKNSLASIGQNKFKKQHTITVIKEPQPKYLDHFESGERGIDVKNGLFYTLQTTGSIDSVQAVGSDGAYTNTGGLSKISWTRNKIFDFKT